MVSRETSAAGPTAHLLALCRSMGVSISPECAAALVAVLDALALEPQNLTTIDDPMVAVERHLSDSLAGLLVPQIASAPSLVDVGSGGGFPGLALAASRPEMAVTLVESERRKADWLQRASAGFPNVRVVAARSEDLALLEREQHHCATARALGPLPVALELTAPLVRVGGLVALWRADRDPEAEAAGARAAAELGLHPDAVAPVTPFPGARRHIHTFRKVAPTPERYPRRPGRAAKRPIA